MNWSQFDSQLEQILRDSSYTQFPASMRMNSYNWAIKNLINFEPKQKDITLTSGALSYDLPSDFYEVVAVWDGTNWCNAIDFSSDSWTSMPNPVTGNSNYDRSFWLYGSKLRFTKALTANGIMFYHGQYDSVATVNATLDIPEPTVQAILYWTVAGCLNYKIVQQGKVAMWGKTNQPGLTSKSMIETYNFYWNEGVRILESIKHRDSEMTLIARSRRTTIN